MALAFAPFYAWPILVVSLPVFFLLLVSANHWRIAALRGFFFGYGHAIGGTWWIANALLVDAEKFGWLFPFSVLGLSAVMALWFVVFALFFCVLRSTSAFMRYASFVVLWVVVEYLRSIGMFGFPWNLAGYIALASLPVAQMASVIGTFGLSLLVIAVGLSPMLLLHCRPRVLLLPLAFIALLYGYGTLRMPPATALTETKLRVVQPNIPQSLKWSREGAQASLKAHAELTLTPGITPNVVIWPETAVPFHLYDGNIWVYRLSKLLPPKAVLITGAVRAAHDEEDPRIWNSLIVIDARSNWRAQYDKHQLVPFGEFMPLRHVLPLEKITAGNVDFSRGAGPQTIAVDALPPFSPLVCYEAIFPWLATDASKRPNWMVNVTNDAWYGDSPGPYQHFEMVRMRAIEQGVPMVRVANTGISAVIDPYGRVVSQLALNTRGIIDSSLPAALGSTTYAHYGEQIVCLILLLFMGFIFYYPNAMKNK